MSTHFYLYLKIHYFTCFYFFISEKFCLKKVLSYCLWPFKQAKITALASKYLHIWTKSNNYKSVSYIFQLGSCSGITVLSVRSNRLSYIPDEIGRIPRLRVLNLSSNQLRCLPFTIVKCKELQALWLSENQVRNQKNCPWFHLNYNFFWLSWIPL